MLPMTGPRPSLYSRLGGQYEYRHGVEFNSSSDASSLTRFRERWRRAFRARSAKHGCDGYRFDKSKWPKMPNVQKRSAEG